MAQPARSFLITTDKDVQFTGALAQNASATADIACPQMPDSSQVKLQALEIISDQQLAWELWLWGKDTYAAGAADLDALFPFGRWAFTVADGVQIAGTGPYYYYIDGLNVAYWDMDKTSEIHLMLVNRSATSKNAGASGEIVVKLVMSPAVGW